MSIRLVSVVEDGTGTIAKAVIIDSASSLEQFKKLVFQGSNLYPNNSEELKSFALQVHQIKAGVSDDSNE